MSNKAIAGKLEAQVQILSELATEARKDREIDRRTTTALLHEIEAIVNRLDELPEMISRIETALSKASTGRLLKTGEMAAHIGIHPDNLRRKAEAGEVPGYQSIDRGHWLFDPQEVKAAIKDTAHERATMHNSGASSDDLHVAALEIKAVKEMEQGL